MTTDDINQAIAESVGWVIPDNCINCVMRPDGKKIFFNPLSEENPLPKYTEDLNAMHEVEKTLDVDVNINGSPRYVYAGHIYNIVGRDCQPFRATARQRAEAYLRTVGKWREA
jgi:hypothetical protein